MRKLSVLAFLTFVLTAAVAAQEINLNIDTSSKGNVEIAKKTETESQFEINGTVTAVNDSSFMVMGELVAVSSDLMNELKSNGTLKAGSFVKVEGKITNNLMVAQEISVEGEEQGEIEVSDNFFKQALAGVKELLSNLL